MSICSATFILRDGQWQPTSCDTENIKFVCKWNNQPIPTPPPPGDCPDGWEDIGGENCYKFFPYTYVSIQFILNLSSLDKTFFQVTWEAARAACLEEMGSDGHHADLASIHSQAESDLLAVRAVSMNSPWIGLVRARDGSLSWTDESALDFENWEAGEPNSIDGDGEDCVQMYDYNGKWNDASCIYMYQDYICMTSKRKSVTKCQITLCIHRIRLLVAQTTSEPPTTEPQTEPNTTPATDPTTTDWQPDTPSTTAWNPDNPTTTTRKTTPTQADNGGETPSKRKFEDLVHNFHLHVY